MSFPSYPEYKSSDVVWLGQIPRHWTVALLKRGFDVCLGKMLQVDARDQGDELAPYVRAANIQWGRIDVDEVKQMWFSPAERRNLKLQVGDLLVSEGGDVGRSSLWKGEIQDCYFQNSVNRVRTHHSHSTSFLYYWMATVKSNGYVDVLCNKSTIAHFTAEKVAQVLVPFPPKQEQRTIASFLDRETAKIDALIALQEKLIALLEEKRQAIISHALTKGLNPNAPLKDSGVEWLGSVPAHWKVSRLGRYISLLSGFAFPSAGFSTDDSETRLLRGVNVGVGRIKWDEGVYWMRTENDGLDEFELRLGQVVLGMDRPWIAEGVRAARITDEDLPCLLLQRVAAFTPAAELDEGFLYLLVSSDLFAAYFSPETTGVSVPHISPSQIANFVVCLPPYEEQTEIVALVDEKSRKYSAMIREAERAIELLKERRSALISAAVTGQIDVRGAVPSHALIDPQCTPYSERGKIEAELEEIRSLHPSIERDMAVQMLEGWIAGKNAGVR